MTPKGLRAELWTEAVEMNVKFTVDIMKRKVVGD